MINYLSIHRVVDIDVESEVIDVKGQGPVAITRYNILQQDGCTFQVTLFHEREEEDDES